MGRNYGRQLKEEINANLKVLIQREGHGPLPWHERHFREWLCRQEHLLQREWPWLLQEMSGVAQGCGAGYEDILLLNLRAWQYDLYSQPPAGGCSSLAVTLADGTRACAGALDDPARYYCGPVHFEPDEGYGFITFPITGTSWGNRGMNSRGLSLGISSQRLPGLNILPGSINQDLALRIILQTCATAEEVREFCRKYHFTINLLCLDAQGDIFCAHQTAAGLFEIPTPDGWSALTNHIGNKDITDRLMKLGVREFPESATTRARYDRLLRFAQRNNGRCTAEQVMEFIGRRDDNDPGSIHNGGTVCLTFSIPQNSSQTLWIMQTEGSDEEKRFFEPYIV